MRMANLQPINVFDATNPRFEPLHHLPLSSIDTFPPSSGSESSGVSVAQDNIYTLISSKKWLLDTDQPLPLPTLSLENKTRPIFTLSDFVIQQDAKLARDTLESSIDTTSGERLLPTPQQMDELRQHAKISVPSRNFVDQQHIWEVSGAFYLGTRRKRERFRDGLGGAIDHLVVFEHDAVVGGEMQRPGLFGNTESLSLLGAAQHGLIKAIKHLWRNLRNFMPWTKVKHLVKYDDSRISMALREAERLYVNHHMRKKTPGYMHHVDGSQVSYFAAWKDLRKDADWSREFIPRSERGELKLQQEVGGRVLSLYRTVKASLNSRRQEELAIDEDRMRKSPRSALEEKKKADAKWRNLEDDETIKAFQEKDDPTLRAEASRLYVEKVQSAMLRQDKQHRTALESEQRNELWKKHPILSASPLWRKRQLGAYSAKVYKKQQDDFDVRLLAKLHQDESDLASAAITPLELRATFLEEDAPRIKEALQSKRVPNRPATVHIPRLHPDDERNLYDRVEVSYEKPFWRAKFYALKFVAHFAGLAFGAFRFLTSGPLSIRALLCPESFLANDGRGRPEVTPTLTSRLKDYFKALGRVRQDFERAPDLSLIGKSVQRFFLRIYLGFKAAIGTVAIVAFMLLGTAIMTGLSSAVLALSPVLAFVFVLLRALSDILIYDCSEPHPQWSPFLNIVIGVPYYLIVPGICQAAVALGTLAAHPIIGLIWLSWSSLRFAWSSLRDGLTWPIIRRNAMIPASDTFLARRIQGPGLASEHLYRMPLQQAFAAVQSLLDYTRLRGHRELRRIEILSPSLDFEEIIQDVVEPFGFGAKIGLKGPDDICRGVIHHWERDHRDHSVHEDFAFAPSGDRDHWVAGGNTWDGTAHRLRKAHPTYHASAPTSSRREVISFASHDRALAAWFEREKSVHLADGEGGKGLLFGEVAKRAGLMLAKLGLLTNIRERRLIDVCSLPPAAQSKFRLPEDEIQLLWRAVTLLAKQYADVMRSELSEIAEKSEQSKVLVPAADGIADAFWIDAGSRPGKDIEIVAARVLSVVFGGELMLEPLEEVDKQLLLVPKMSEEDKHVDFFGMRDDFALEYEIVEPKDVILDIHDI